MAKVISCLASLERNFHDEEGFEFYTELFEKPLITQAEEHYTALAKLISTASIPEYVKRTQESIRSESDLAERFLPIGMHRKLISKCEDILVRNHIVLLQDGYQELFDNNRDKDLRNLCAVFACIPESFELIFSRFTEHVVQEMHTVISRVGFWNDNDFLDPKTFTNALVIFYDTMLVNINVVSGITRPDLSNVLISHCKHL